jgi:hypothetical protein
MVQQQMDTTSIMHTTVLTCICEGSTENVLRQHPNNVIN